MPSPSSERIARSCGSPTLYDEFIVGCAGVTMGARCARSRGFRRGFHARASSADGGVKTTGFGQSHASKTRKNLATTVDGAAFGNRWQTNATRIAQFTPPSRPRTLEYRPFCRAHRFTALSATLNAATSGTSLRSSSATRAPFKDRTAKSSSPSKIASSMTSSGSGSAARWSGAKRRSTSVDPARSLTTGVYASRTGMTRPGPTSGLRSSRRARRSKNALRVQWRGATRTTSTSASGAWTSNRTLPNVRSSQRGASSRDPPWSAHSSAHHSCASCSRSATRRRRAACPASDS
mmetsp:Transcript_24114/g.74344  ORF Transcript_24114/g.74344 Transcript_24114/m.74344 type:complete len:292 (-) Transcript_24114:199-1074(-)